MKPDTTAAKALFEKYRLPDHRFPTDLEALGREVSAMPNEKAVRMGLSKLADVEIRRLSRERAAHLRSRDRLDRHIEEIKSLDGWVDAPFMLERPGASSLHHLRQALKDGKAFLLGCRDDKFSDGFEEVLAEANCFVVEHDWAKAFAGATDFSEGDIRLPYEVCAFDFKISGRRIVALMTTDADNCILMQLLVRGANEWMVDDDVCRHQDGKWLPIAAGQAPERNVFQGLTEFIGSQVRAITIALDAQVAETEVVRVNEKLARSRERSGHVVPKPYHVVSLARRTRAAPLASSGEPEHGKVRLHFRRGHWRHYEDHKTWIRWMLVGNPDLGFVDKEYRL